MLRWSGAAGCGRTIDCTYDNDGARVEPCHWASNSQGARGRSAFISAFGGVRAKTEMIWIVRNLCLPFDGGWWTGMKLNASRGRVDNRLRRWPKTIAQKYTSRIKDSVVVWALGITPSARTATGDLPLPSISQYRGWITNHRAHSDLPVLPLCNAGLKPINKLPVLQDEKQSLCSLQTAQTSPPAPAARCN